MRQNHIIKRNKDAYESPDVLVNTEPETKRRRNKSTAVERPTTTEETPQDNVEEATVVREAMHEGSGEALKELRECAKCSVLCLHDYKLMQMTEILE